MISGGNATIIVADIDRSIRFYTEVLGLKLTNRFGNDWATVSAGEGLTIGIHPASTKYPTPGNKRSDHPRAGHRHACGAGGREACSAGCHH